MTCAEVLAQYDPIRTGIRRVLREAGDACNPTELKRAVRQVASWAEPHQLNKADAIEMLLDIALFEPNQRSRRGFDRFLDQRVARLGTADRLLAEQMAAAWFSIFRIAGRHEVAGLWLEDMVDETAPLWLVDNALETSASEGLVFGIRLFDAGPFHAGFGIVVHTDDETLQFCQTARADGRSTPFRESIPATLYGDKLRAETPPGAADLEMMRSLLEVLHPDLAVPREADGGPPARRTRAASRRK